MRLKTMLMMLFFAFGITVAIQAPAHAQTRHITVLGDSLTAGYGLQGGQDYPAQLQKALRARNLNVTIANAGVSGDTAAGGLSRIDWAIGGQQKPDLVIVALGANDMLRGIALAETNKNLRGIMQKLKDRNIPAILYGMKAPTNLPSFFRSNLEKMYTQIAKDFDVPLYPFFLEGVALNPALNIDDGIHPNEKGIAIMVERTVPVVTKALQTVR